MRYFSVEMDEDQFLQWIKTVIDQYEQNLHDLGSYDKSVSAVQDIAIQCLVDNAEDQTEQVKH